MTAVLKREANPRRAGCGESRMHGSEGGVRKHSAAVRLAPTLPTKDLRENGPLPRYILHTWPHDPGLRGSDRIQWHGSFQRMTEGGHGHVPLQRMSGVNWFYPLAGRDTAKSGMGWV
jgi:hypothetical protein